MSLFEGRFCFSRLYDDHKELPRRRGKRSVGTRSIIMETTFGREMEAIEMVVGVWTKSSLSIPFVLSSPHCSSQPRHPSFLCMAGLMHYSLHAANIQLLVR